MKSGVSPSYLILERATLTVARKESDAEDWSQSGYKSPLLKLALIRKRIKLSKGAHQINPPKTVAQILITSYISPAFVGDVFGCSSIRAKGFGDLVFWWGGWLVGGGFTTSLKME